MAAKLELICRTDPGLLRSHNEDSVGGDLRLGLAVLADGMGGYQAGEIASDIAVATVLREVSQHSAELAEQETPPPYPLSLREILRHAVLAANRAIYQAAEDQPEYRGMGTTIVAALWHESRLGIAHVGDSRLYRLRDGKIAALTTDHSVMQEWIKLGWCTPEQARRSPNRNLVTRALGINLDVDVEAQEVEVERGDLFLLCSDGLNEMLEDHAIQAILKHSQNDLEHAAAELIKAANAGGGVDNISVILARPLHLPQPGGWLKRLLGR